MKNGERVPGCRLQEGASCSDQKKQAYDRDLLFPLKMKRDDKILAYEKMRLTLYLLTLSVITELQLIILL